MNIRDKSWSHVENKEFDVAIIGAGINGAAVYKKLCSEGYNALLIDKGDFSCGTSQASAMMIWGGLLYLKNLDISSVFALSKDRDILISSCKEQIKPAHFRYVFDKNDGRNKFFVYSALHFYWLLGFFRREKPELQDHFEELSFIKRDAADGSINYQEGFLKWSDSRFVLDWILSCQSMDSLALNYCAIQEGRYDQQERHWLLSLSDLTANHRCTVKAKVLINCAGVWTDKVNEQFNIQSNYKHVFSKGVFIAYERPKAHRQPLVFEMGEHGDTLTLIPWGPVSLWGPTESLVQSIEDGFTITAGDIDFLQEHARRRLKSTLADSRIVSLRCGLRPLVVKKEFKADCYPLDLSRHYKIVEDPVLPWISVYGGKLSGCISLAGKVAAKISRKVSKRPERLPSHSDQAENIRWNFFPGLEERVPTIDWCVENEFCCTLEDYLRRRTNISQWVPREGLGFNNENVGFLGELAAHLPPNNAWTPRNHLKAYVNTVQDGCDRLMKTCKNHTGGLNEPSEV
jgi:glycerol-3-phosphate dehydrogenase